MKAPDTMCFQCPLCKNWQLDYSMNLMFEHWGSLAVGPTGMMEPVLAGVYDTIDDVYREHLVDEHPAALRRFDRIGKIQ